MKVCKICLTELTTKEELCTFCLVQSDEEPDNQVDYYKELDKKLKKRPESKDWI